MNPVIHDTEALNHLLQSELSAVETYTQALNQFEDLEVIGALQTMRDEHSRAVRALRDQIVLAGATPADHAGAWSTFTVSGFDTAEVIGPATLLAVLCQSEEHGLREYEAALSEVELQLDTQRLICTQLLPLCRANAEKLNALLGGMGH